MVHVYLDMSNLNLYSVVMEKKDIIYQAINKNIYNMHQLLTFFDNRQLTFS